MAENTKMVHVWQGVMREYADRLGVTDASTVVTLGRAARRSSRRHRCRR